MKPKTLFLAVFFMINSNIEAQDWANLSRYSESNKKLLAADISEIRVVFMGNSITEGWGTLSPEFFLDKSYINRGIGGQTTPQMLIRFRPDVIDLNPMAVVILAGTNDIAGNTGPMTLDMITSNIKTMAELAEGHGIKVVLCSVLPAFDYPWKAGLKPANKIIALNTLIKDYAEIKGFIYLDYFTAMVDDRNGLKGIYSEDGVHPTKVGYEVMAPLAKEAIKKALGE